MSWCAGISDRVFSHFSSRPPARGREVVTKFHYISSNRLVRHTIKRSWMIYEQCLIRPSYQTNLPEVGFILLNQHVCFWRKMRWHLYKSCGKFAGSFSDTEIQVTAYPPGGCHWPARKSTPQMLPKKWWVGLLSTKSESNAPKRSTWLMIMVEYRLNGGYSSLMFGKAFSRNFVVKRQRVFLSLDLSCVSRFKLCLWTNSQQTSTD